MGSAPEKIGKYYSLEIAGEGNMAVFTAATTRSTIAKLPSKCVTRSWKR